MNLWYRSDYSIVDHDFIYNLQYRSIYDDIVDNEWYIIYINNNIIYNYDTVDYDYFGDYDTHDIDSSFSIDARAIVASVVWVGRVSSSSCRVSSGVVEIGVGADPESASIMRAF